MKMTKSEAGKIGNLRSRETALRKQEERIETYLKTPKKCKHCEKVLEYNERTKTFCGSSCAATFNNRQRNKKTRKRCLACGTAETRNRYCSIPCQHDYQYRKALKSWIETGIGGKGVIRRYLKETVGNCCSICGITEWNEKSIVFELEHKDGDSENNTKENVCLICPNCHSQTDTYKGKNKGNGRHSRRVRYQEGKSY